MVCISGSGGLHRPNPACTLDQRISAVLGTIHFLRRERMQRIWICILGALFFLPAAWPQASSTTVRGTVRDKVEAIVPGAKVTLTNTATNVERTTPTNEAGVYVFPGVFPGPYRIAVESPGMQKYEANLTVQAQQDASIDVVLQVGQTVTQVEVQYVTPMLTTDNPTLGHSL